MTDATGLKRRNDPCYVVCPSAGLKIYTLRPSKVGLHHSAELTCEGLPAEVTIQIPTGYLRGLAEAMLRLAQDAEDAGASS